MEHEITNLMDFILKLLKQEDIIATCSAKVEEPYIYINFKTQQINKLIGYHGKNINNLQIIAHIFMSKLGLRSYKIQLDVDDYREKRREQLIKLAEYAYNQALNKQIRYQLPAMPSFERRIIHNILKEKNGIQSFSSGNRNKRYITVVPNKLFDK